MGRTLIKVAAVLILLVLVGALALAIYLPRMLQTEEVQADLRARASAALGSEVDWHHVEVGLFPPRLILDSLELVGAVDQTHLRAEAVDLRVALGPLLGRRVEMSSLLIRGLDLAVMRTDEGWALPVQPGSAAADGEASPEGGVAAGAFSMTLGRIGLSGARVLVRDRAAGRALDWQLDGGSLAAEEAGSIGDFDLVFAGDLAVGGSHQMEMGPVKGSGQLRLVEGQPHFDLAIDLTAARLAPLVSYLPIDAGTGRVAGRVTARGVGANWDEIRADLLLSELDTRFAGVDLRGEVAIDGGLPSGGDADFEVDARLGENGAFALKGTRKPDGHVHAVGTLDHFQLGAARFLDAPARELAGRATGPIDFHWRPDGTFDALEAEVEITDFRYADAQHRLDSGVLELELDFLRTRAPESEAGAESSRYQVAAMVDGGIQLPADGARILRGGLDAQISFDGADLAALPFDFTLAVLPEGRASGGIAVDGALRSVISKGSSSAAAGVTSSTPASVEKQVEGLLEVDAKFGRAGPIDLGLGWGFSEGGSVSATGTSTRAGNVDLALGFDAVDLARLASLLPLDSARLHGVLSGPGRVRGPLSDPARFEIDAQVMDGELALDDYSVTGPYAVTLAVDSPLSARRKGNVTLDLTAARVLYETRFEKKPGIGAQLEARFEPDAAGGTTFDSTFKLRDLAPLRIQGSVGETSRASVTAAAFDLGIGAEFFPLLAEMQATGRATLDGFSVVRPPSGALRFGGRLAFDGASVRWPEAGRLGLTGALVGDGSRLRTDALRVVAEGVTLALEGHVEDPLGEAPFALAARTVGTPEVNDLLSAVTTKKDTLFGPLAFEGDVSGTRVGETLVDSLIGTLRFSIGEDVGGRLRGVSILRAVLDQIPLLGNAEAWSKPFRGGRSVDDYFSDEFEVIEGEFAIRQGRLEAQRLRLGYSGYDANLEGVMTLNDLSLDMTGELLLKSDLVAALVGSLGFDGTDREPIAIPLARVTNTLPEPKVSMTARTLAAIPRIILQSTGLDRLGEGLGKILQLPRNLIGNE